MQAAHYKLVEPIHRIYLKEVKDANIGALRIYIMGIRWEAKESV